MWLCAHFAGMQIEAKPSHVRVRGGGKGRGEVREGEEVLQQGVGGR